MVQVKSPSRMGRDRGKHRGEPTLAVPLQGPGAGAGAELLAECGAGAGQGTLLHVRLLSSVLSWHSFLEPLGQQDPPLPP